MNLEKNKVNDFVKAYDSKDFFIIMFIVMMLVSPCYQIWHDFIAKDSEITVPGMIINTNEMKIDSEYNYTITVVDLEKKYTPIEHKVDARVFFKSKIGMAHTYTYDNPQVNQVLLIIAYGEYCFVVFILFMMLLALGGM